MAMSESAFLHGAATIPSEPRDIIHVQTPSAPPKPPKPRHRPTGYDQDIANAFCEAIADGELSMRAICKLDWFPSRSTIFAWLAKHEDFQVAYAGALRWRAAQRADDCIDIADNASDDYRPAAADPENPDGAVTMVLNPTSIARARLQIDTRKWLISKEFPERYGDKLALLPPGKRDGDPGDDAKLIGESIPAEQHPLKHSIEAWKVSSGRAAGVIAG